MRLTRQHIERECPVRQKRSNADVVIRQEEVRKFLTDYELSGPAFQSKDGRAMHRTHVSTLMRDLCEMGSLRSLWKIYSPNRFAVESNAALLEDQGMERMMEKEQRSVDWEAQ